jgi:general secretion pathway protein C
MTARLLAFVVWAAVAATAVFWALRLLVSAPPAPPHTVAAADAGAARGDLARIFGADPVAGPAPAAPAPSRFQLVGVVAPRPGAPARVGVALIAVDDKPPRAYRVGAPIDDRLVVQAVQGRTVSLGPRGAPAEVQLELPALPEAATGTLPNGASPARQSPAQAPGGRGQARQSQQEGPPQEPPQQEPLAGQEPPDSPGQPGQSGPPR